MDEDKLPKTAMNLIPIRKTKRRNRDPWNKGINGAMFEKYLKVKDGRIEAYGNL